MSAVKISIETADGIVVSGAIPEATDEAGVVSVIRKLHGASFARVQLERAMQAIVDLCEGRETPGANFRAYNAVKALKERVDRAESAQDPIEDEPR